jgi:hypothetical protein
LKTKQFKLVDNDLTWVIDEELETEYIEVKRPAKK